ncbi:MAG: hypothetical protein DELT_01686 [Desulfovibrio sp.]
MCIIAVKPYGKAPLPLATITACWNNNPDGAGFVIRRPEHDTVLIQKGFMTLDELTAALEASAIQDSDTVIYHFRIATSGGITPANCHPFPVSASVDDLKTLTIACKTAFVHNGILGKGRDDLSDTQLYVLNTLSRYGSIKRSLPRIRKDTAGSRTAILNADGQLWLTGRWIEKDGYHYSNETYVDYGWYDFGDPSSRPDKCDCCRSKLALVEWDGVLLCEQCSAEYAPCHHCGCWNFIGDMDAAEDENGDEVHVCYSCSDEPNYGYGWNDEHRKSSIRSVIERLLRD